MASGQSTSGIKSDASAPVSPQRDWQQRGIYIEPGPQGKAPRFFAVVLVNTRVYRPSALTRIVELLDAYAKLRDSVENEGENGLFDVLVGFNREVSSRIFDGVTERWPDADVFASPGERRKILLGADKGLAFAEDMVTNPGAADAIIQVTSEDEFTVARVLEETARFAAEHSHEVYLTAAYRGSRRADSRGWLDFHEGVSNIARTDRHSVIFGDGDGGTFLCFMRLGVNLHLWRKAEADQEKWVGRDKATGAAIKKDGTLHPDIAAGETILDSDDKSLRETPDDVIEGSHIDLARKATVAGQPARVFRQGYEYFEIDPNRVERSYPAGEHSPSTASVGLNFVSFQARPAQLFEMLRDPDALGGTSFSAESDGDGKPLVTVAAAGMFYVPSKATLDQRLQEWRAQAKVDQDAADD